jgi:hypothetical protein
MKRLSIAICALMFALSLTACSTVAPPYAPTLNNIATLKNADHANTKVGAFASSPGTGNANPISLRGTSMNSPYNGSYANYVAEAIKQELTLAGKYSTDARIEISGTLLSNDIDASGFSTGRANIAARFVVKNNETVKFDKVKSVVHEWDSSFVGAIAIPAAIREYSATVNKLLAALYADTEFDAAVK